MFIEIVLLILIIVSWKWLTWRSKSKLTTDEERSCVDHISLLDEDCGEIEVLTPEFIPRAGGFLSAIVRLAKNEFGQLKPNRANHEIVRRFLYKKMLDRKMTAGDISRHLPLATNLVFIVNQSELFAAKFLLSVAARENAELREQLEPSGYYAGFNDA